MSEGKTKALHYFIREATVGELNYILEDISSIMGNKDFLQDPEIIEALRNYYEAHLSHFKTSDGNSVVITEKGRQPSDGASYTNDGEGDAEENSSSSSSSVFTYIDEARNIKFTFDVTTGEVKASENADHHSDEAVEGLKTSLVESLDKYISEGYKENTTLGTVSVSGSDEVEAHIDISCHNLNHKNFWGGEWLSQWVVRHNIGSNDYELSGSIKVTNHYFEQGNIQFKLDKKFENESGVVKDDAAQSIINHIEKLENEYQASLETMYEDIKETHMKSLRRKLPFTGKSFDWGVPKLEF